MVETFQDWHNDSTKQSPLDRLSLLNQHDRASEPGLSQAIDASKLHFPAAIAEMTKPDSTLQPAGAEQKTPVIENALPKMDFTLHSVHNPDLTTDALVAGTGFVASGVATAAGEYAILRTAEPFAKILGALAFAPLSGHVAANIYFAPRLPWYTLITPKPVLAGAAIGATMAVGGYELYKHFLSD